jgi:mannose-6-phosphate isomerase-like protein (cupin superfamily)
MKRIVTGHDEDGKAVFTSVGEPGRVVDIDAGPVSAGFYEMWATSGESQVPDSAVAPEADIVPMIPGNGGTRFRLFRIGPDRPAAGADLSGMAADIAQLLPGFAETLELDNPGMHTTDTIDYIVAISGSADLELDDGVKVRVEPGDCVIQRGTRHAWRNNGSDDFVAAAIMIGAVRG